LAINTHWDRIWQRANKPAPATIADIVRKIGLAAVWIKAITVSEARIAELNDTLPILQNCRGIWERTRLSLTDLTNCVTASPIRRIAFLTRCRVHGAVSALRRCAVLVATRGLASFVTLLTTRRTHNRIATSRILTGARAKICVAAVTVVTLLTGFQDAISALYNDLCHTRRRATVTGLLIAIVA
jgi:hypothetical protein